MGKESSERSAGSQIDKESNSEAIRELRLKAFWVLIRSDNTLSPTEVKEVMDGLYQDMGENEENWIGQEVLEGGVSLPRGQVLRKKAIESLARDRGMEILSHLEIVDDIQKIQSLIEAVKVRRKK